MKTFAIFTFLTFMVCLSVKIYSNRTEKLLSMSITKNATQDIFEIEPEKARQLLDTLDAVTFADPKVAKEFKREIAQGKEELEILSSELIAAFNLPEDNIDEIYELQSALREKNEEYNILPKNLEVWGPDFIYYLVIKEGYSFDSLDDINGIRELGFGTDKIITMKRTARSNKFMLEILLFKNAINDDEYYQSLAIIEDKNQLENENTEIEDIDSSRSIANYSEEDDENGNYRDYRNQLDDVDLETKLLEENYDPEELEEIKYGYESSEEYN